MAYVAVAYDVPSNRRRSRLAKALEGYLGRVQKSVFEGELAESRLGDLRRVVERHVDLSEDNVRIYHLCVRCRHATEMMGVAAPAREGGDEIF
jgi:CRISPR-associated protein Cas2